MFAYCNNNPVAYTDPEGNLPGGIINPNAMALDSGSSLHPIPDQERLQDQAKTNSNSSEEVVLNTEDYAFYKGALVVRHSSDFLTSWSLFGVIFLNRSVHDGETLKHEYGHYLQEKQYGTVKYITAIFIPSTVYNGFSRLSPVLNYNYYNMPWEYDADKRGGVNREHASWTAEFAAGYYAIQGMLP